MPVCFRPLKTEISGSRVTTEILNDCHDNVVALRIQLKADPLPEPVELTADLTLGFWASSQGESRVKQGSESGYWPVGGTRSFSLSHPIASVGPAGIPGAEVMVRAALFEGGTSGGDRRLLDSIVSKWHVFRDDFRWMQKLLNAREVEQETTPRKKLVRLHQIEEATRLNRLNAKTTDGSAGVRERTPPSMIIQSMRDRLSDARFSDDHAAIVLNMLHQMATRQIQEYDRLLSLFDASAMNH